MKCIIFYALLQNKIFHIITFLLDLQSGHFGALSCRNMLLNKEQSDFIFKINAHYSEMKRQKVILFLWNMSAIKAYCQSVLLSCIVLVLWEDFQHLKCLPYAFVFLKSSIDFENFFFFFNTMYLCKTKLQSNQILNLTGKNK